MVIDRGNQAIREIQLNDDDCSYDYDGSFHLGIMKKINTSLCHFYFKIIKVYKMCFDIAGIAVLVAAAFFGYMLALLQQRVRAMFSSKDVSYPRICVFNL